MKRSMLPPSRTTLRNRLLRAINRGRRARVMEVTVEPPSLLRRMFLSGWVNVVGMVFGKMDGGGDEGLGRSQALEWELVLKARHVPCRVRKSRGLEQWGVFVQPWFQERAVGELRLYMDENQPVPKPSVLPAPRPGELGPTLVLMACLSIFYAWYSTPHPSLDLYAPRWLAAGSAHAEAILSGQWWRLLTALTLHADGPHLAGNVLIGGVFIILACRVLGSGLAWLLVIASGASGNLLNAMVLGASHNSIGFSTAVFGAAGVLSGIRLAEGSGTGIRRALVPVGAGLGILAILGAGGENTDLGAHLFGFVSGVALGLPSGFIVVRKGRPCRMLGGVLLTVAAGAPLVAWWLAML